MPSLIGKRNLNRSHDLIPLSIGGAFYLPSLISKCNLSRPYELGLHIKYMQAYSLESISQDWGLGFGEHIWDM